MTTRIYYTNGDTTDGTLKYEISKKNVEDGKEMYGLLRIESLCNKYRGKMMVWPFSGWIEPKNKAVRKFEWRCQDIAGNKYTVKGTKEGIYFYGEILNDNGLPIGRIRTR